MAGAARGRKADGAGAHGLLREPRHRGEFVLARLAVEGALSHDIGAQRGMSHIAGVVERLGRGVDGVEIFGIALPRPVDAGKHRLAGDVFRAFEIPEHVVGFRLAARRQGEAAIAHHCGGDTVVAGTTAERIPERLGVHVGVTVDEARRDDHTLGVYGPASGFGDAPDARDAPAGNADIGAVAREPRTVDHHTVRDHDIVRHCPTSPGGAPRPRRRDSNTRDGSHEQASVLRHVGVEMSDEFAVSVPDAGGDAGHRREVALIGLGPARVRKGRVHIRPEAVFARRDLFQKVVGRSSEKWKRTIDLMCLKPYFHGTARRNGAPNCFASGLP